MDAGCQYLMYVPLASDVTGTRWAAILQYIQVHNLNVSEDAFLNILYFYDSQTFQVVREFAWDEGTHFLAFMRI